MFNSDPAWTPAQFRSIEKRADEFSYETDDAALSEVMQCGLRHAFRNTRLKLGRNGHKTTRVEGVDIDDELVDLIKEVWAAGIRTSMSCQNNVPANYCWIEFTDQKELNRFLSAVVNNIPFDDSRILLAARIQQSTNDFELQWLYSYNPIFDPEQREMTMNIGVRFPQCDIERVCRCLKEHNRKKNAPYGGTKKRKQEAK